jgi:hypothetical protein
MTQQASTACYRQGFTSITFFNKQICLCDGNLSILICKHHTQDAAVQENQVHTVHSWELQTMEVGGTSTNIQSLVTYLLMEAQRQ